MTFVPAPGYQPTYNPVNLALGPEPGVNIAFHFNPHLDGWDKVVFNSKLSGQWGKEEERRMPFKTGEHFELLVMVMQEHYKVLVNGSLFYEFGHWIPLQKVTQPVLESLPTTSSPACHGGTPIFNQPVPYMWRLQRGLMNHRTIIIRFYINFSVGTTGDVSLTSTRAWMRRPSCETVTRKVSGGPRRGASPTIPLVQGSFLM